MNDAVSVHGTTKPLASDATQIANPYVGPRPFRQNEEHLFFGRDREARDLVSLIIANRVLVLYSQSGAGKSSLLNTKIITGLEKEQCRVLPIARVQGNVPPSLTEDKIRNIFSFNVMLRLCTSSESDDTFISYNANIGDFVASLYKAAPDFDEPIVLIIDQFEELFSGYEHRWHDRAPFIEELVDALDRFSEFKIVLAMREDYIAKLDSFRNYFRDRLSARYHLERLNEAAAVEAVAGPVTRSSRHYDKGVVEAIVADLLETQARDLRGSSIAVKGEFVEPVQLQVVCSNLWASMSPDATHVTKDHLVQSGSVDEALRRFYDDSITQVVNQLKISERRLRNWFDTALITAARTRGTVFRDHTTTAGIANNVVDALVDQHIIRGDWRAGAQWYEITHDRLLRPIRDSNRDWFERFDRIRRIKMGASMLVVAVPLLFVLTIYWSQHRKALEIASKEAAALALAATSAKLPPNDFDLALVLAVDAVKTKELPATRNNLLNQLQKVDRLQDFQRLNRDMVDCVALPGSTLIACVTSDRALLLWNVQNGLISALATSLDNNSPSILSDGVEPFRIFADEKRLYIIPPRGEPQSFDIEALASAKDLHPQTAANPLSGQLVKALEDSSAQANTLAAGYKSPPMPRDFELRRTVAVAGDRIALGLGGRLIIRAATTGTEIWKYEMGFVGERPEIFDVGLSADGKFAFALACSIPDLDGHSSQAAQKGTAGCPRFATVLDIENKRKIPFSLPPNDRLRTMAIGNTGDQIWVALGSSDGSIEVRRGEARGLSNTFFSDFPDQQLSFTATGPVTSLQFTQDLKSLISISGRTIMTWNVSGLGRLERKVRDGFPLDIATIKPEIYGFKTQDGFLVTGANDQELLAGKATDNAAGSAIALAPDPDRVLVTQDENIELWSIPDRKRLLSKKLPGGTISVALDPKGKYFANGFLPSSQPSDDLSNLPVLWSIVPFEPKVFRRLQRRKSSADDKDAIRESVVVGVAFSSDGLNFATSQAEGSDGSVDIYKRPVPGNTDEFLFISTLRTESPPLIPTFSPNGRLLAVPQINGDITLWDTTNFRLVDKLAIQGISPRVAFSPDGQLLATVTADGRLVLWDVPTRTLIGTVNNLGNTGRTIGIVFSPNGQRVVTGSALTDSLIEIDLNLASWIQQACAIIPQRLLSREERQRLSLPPETTNPCLSSAK